MKHCMYLGQTNPPEVASEDLPMVHCAETPDRARYKYAKWSKNESPITPLHIRKLPNEVQGAVLSMLPQALLEREMPGVYYMHMPKPCAESESLPPHIDGGRRTAINIYLKCSGEVTEFYDADEATETLTAVERFVAEPHEMWALDVAKPHAVKMTKAMERAAISISFRHVKFSELVTYFQ